MNQKLFPFTLNDVDPKTLFKRDIFAQNIAILR